MSESLDRSRSFPHLGLWFRLAATLSCWDRQRKAARAKRLPLPVISIGGLTLGGSGKTPLTCALAEALSSRGLQVGILSRGYRRRSRHPLLVSRGRGPLEDAAKTGDEPYLLAASLPGVSVAVASERHDAGRLLLEQVPGIELFLLDDGFSHRQLLRDLDLVVLSGEDPFGGLNFPPFGQLRVSPHAVREAHAVVWIEPAVDLGNEEKEEALKACQTSLQALGFSGPIFAAKRQWDKPRAANGSNRDILPGTPVVAVSGLARPESFHHALQRMQLSVQEYLDFPDHHPYPARSLRKIREVTERTGAQWVVTTAKDLPKLAWRLKDLSWAVLPYRVAPEPRLLAWILERIGGLQP